MFKRYFDIGPKNDVYFHSYEYTLTLQNTHYGSGINIIFFKCFIGPMVTGRRIDI